MATDDRSTIHTHVSPTDHQKAKEVRGEREREGEREGEREEKRESGGG
jgi:hypothetical protein